MAADFSTPLSRALQRTRRILFDGFDPSKYLILGFAAFLATLPDSCTPTSAYRWSGPFGDWDRGDWSPRLVLGDGGWSGAFHVLELFGALFLVALAVLAVLLWLGANGKLIWFENVLYDRGAIVDPWSRLSRLSNSLFLWTLAFFAVAIAVGLAAAVPLGLSLSGVEDGNGLIAFTGILGAALSGGFLAILSVVLSFVWMATNHFVVPIMYRDGRTAFQAWGKFAGLLRRAPVDFLLYALLILLIHILVGLLLVLLVILTCCVMWLPLAIPYVSTLVMLPVLTFYRTFSIEFLSQFGEEFAIEPAWTSGPDAPSAG